MTNVGPAALLWTNAPLALYHGTLEQRVPPLMRGIDLGRARPRTDFGSGFYTTTSETQAREWARELARRAPGSAPAVMRFTVSREALAELHCLWFTHGDACAEDFWSFVHHCRQGIQGHGASIAGGWYDVVVGPVALNWARRPARPSSDQVSFHTNRATALLNASGPQRV